jgi:hypothetical protein
VVCVRHSSVVKLPQNNADGARTANPPTKEERKKKLITAACTHPGGECLLLPAVVVLVVPASPRVVGVVARLGKFNTTVPLSPGTAMISTVA